MTPSQRLRMAPCSSSEIEAIPLSRMSRSGAQSLRTPMTKSDGASGRGAATFMVELYCCCMTGLTVASGAARASARPSAMAASPAASDSTMTNWTAGKRSRSVRWAALPSNTATRLPRRSRAPVMNGASAAVTITHGIEKTGRVNAR